MKLNRPDIWRRALKRYLQSEGYYEGDISDDKWTQACERAWYDFCANSGAVYKADPDPVNQPVEIKRLFELLYEYEVLLRVDEGKKEPPPPKHLVGAEWLRSRMPDAPRDTPENEGEETPPHPDDELRRSMEAAIASAVKRKAPKVEETKDAEPRSSKVRIHRKGADKTTADSTTKVRGHD
jgi:hypothetical protein